MAPLLALTLLSVGITQPRAPDRSQPFSGVSGVGAFPHAATGAAWRGRELGRRTLVAASWVLASGAAIAPPSLAAEILVEGEVGLGDALASRLAGKELHVEVIARRLGKGIIATKQIDVTADKLPTRFYVYTDDLAAGINLEKTRADDIFLLATLDVRAPDGSLKRIAQNQGKAPIKKGERLRPLLSFD
jgi:hypothetical protein